MILSSGVNQLRLANAVGILLLLALSHFGITLDSEQQTALNTVLPALGLLINQIITEYNAKKGTMLSDAQATKAEVTTVTPSTVQGDVTMVSGKDTSQGGFITVPQAYCWTMVAAILLILGCIPALHGCTSTQSAQDSLATGYTLVTTAAQEIGKAKASGTITAAQRDTYIAQVQKAKDALDVAADVLPVNATDAATKAAAAQAILQALIIELQKLQPVVQGALT